MRRTEGVRWWPEEAGSRADRGEKKGVVRKSGG